MWVPSSTIMSGCVVATSQCAKGTWPHEALICPSRVGTQNRGSTSIAPRDDARLMSGEEWSVVMGGAVPLGFVGLIKGP